MKKITLKLGKTMAETVAEAAAQVGVTPAEFIEAKLAGTIARELAFYLATGLLPATANYDFVRDAHGGLVLGDELMDHLTGQYYQLTIDAAGGGQAAAETLH